MTPNSNYLTSIELNASKIRKKDLYLLADVVELACLQDIDHEITIEEALDEQRGENEGIGGIVDIEQINDEKDLDLFPALQNDRHATQLSDIQNHLVARNNLFGDSYPFVVSDDGFIKLKDKQSMQHKLYIFMLLSSHLCFLPKCDRYKFTSDFEILGAFALNCIFPNWTFRIFGTAKCEHLQSYTGTPRKKLEQLAEDLGLRLLIQEQELQRLQTPSGDAELDAVAWHPFNDGASHMPVFLAQIGCTDDESQMIRKQYSVSPERWKYKLEGLAAIGCMVTPQCYRNANSSWPCSSEICGIFIDRARVLSLLTISDKFNFEILKMSQVVESIVS